MRIEYSLVLSIQSIFHDATGTTWKAFSEVRWYSKYNILEDVFKKFGNLLAVVMKIVEDGISQANSMKLYELLVDRKKSFKHVACANSSKEMAPTCVQGVWAHQGIPRFVSSWCHENHAIDKQGHNGSH